MQIPANAIPDSTCSSGYARKNSFDPDRQAPFCISEQELAVTTGKLPAAVVEEPACPSGYGRSGTFDPERDGPVCIKESELPSLLGTSPLTTTKTAKKANLHETVLRGSLAVHIQEFDGEGGSHTRTVDVPLNAKAEGKLDYSKATLQKMKLDGLLLARDKLREAFGVSKDPPRVFFGKKVNAERVRENAGDYDDKTLRRIMKKN